MMTDVSQCHERHEDLQGLELSNIALCQEQTSITLNVYYCHSKQWTQSESGCEFIKCTDHEDSGLVSKLWQLNREGQTRYLVWVITNSCRYG